MTQHSRIVTTTRKGSSLTEEIKKAFSEDILLCHFNPDAKVFVLVYVYHSRLCAILMHGQTVDSVKPVALDSRSTTPVEQRCLQID